jgi:hypothetical protein
MAEFWDIGQFKEGNSGKTRFIKLGYATEKKGGGFYCHLDCLPLPGVDDRNGKITCQFVIQPPKGTYGGGQQPQEQSGGGFDEGVPF